MNDNEAKQKLEEKYLIMQLLDAQIKELEKELTALETQNQNLLKLKESLFSLEKSNADSKGYSTIGAGIYVESSIKDTKTVLVNVGAGVIVKKSVQETSELLTKQLKQSENIVQKLSSNLQILSEKAAEMQMELQDVVNQGK